MIYNELGKTGLQVSKLGFGCASLGNEYGALDQNAGIRAVHLAIDEGINFFDTSPYYGRTLSETRLGKALQGKRDRVILATKGGRRDVSPETGFDFSYAGIIQMCEESLQRLQTDYLDIYQLHDIEFGDEAQLINEAIPALHKLKQDGKVRFIGVTGYPLHFLRKIIKHQELDTALSYCHYNLMNRTLNEVLVPLIQTKGMGLINGSVTHMGLLTNQGPQSWHPAPPQLQTVAQKVANYCQEQGENIAHLAIQFALQNPYTHVTLLGARTVDELQSSLSLLEQAINQNLLNTVLEMIEPVKNFDWQSGRIESN